jgi:hypothetical protein
MASKECEQKSWFRKRSFENVETEPDFPIPCPPQKKRALRATQMIKEKGKDIEKAKRGLEILKSKLKPVEEGNLLVKKENGTKEIPLSHFFLSF